MICISFINVSTFRIEINECREWFSTLMETCLHSKHIQSVKQKYCYNFYIIECIIVLIFKNDNNSKRNVHQSFKFATFCIIAIQVMICIMFKPILAGSIIQWVFVTNVMFYMKTLHLTCGCDLSFRSLCIQSSQTMYVLVTTVLVGHNCDVFTGRSPRARSVNMLRPTKTVVTGLSPKARVNWLSFCLR